MKLKKSACWETKSPVFAVSVDFSIKNDLLFRISMLAWGENSAKCAHFERILVKICAIFCSQTGGSPHYNLLGVLFFLGFYRLFLFFLFCCASPRIIPVITAFAYCSTWENQIFRKKIRIENIVRISDFGIFFREKMRAKNSTRNLRSSS